MRRFAQGNWWQIAFWLEEYFFTAEMNLIVFNSSANAKLDKQNVATINFIWEFFYGVARAGSSNSFSRRTVRPRGAVGLQGSKLFSFLTVAPEMFGVQFA